jgi:nucleoid DNA-binding protein
MKNLTKKELTKQISNLTEVKREDTKKVLERFFDLVPKLLRDGRSIEIRNFGKFTVVVRKEKIGRIIKLDKSILIPEHRELIFKFSENIRKIF